MPNRTAVGALCYEPANDSSEQVLFDRPSLSCSNRIGNIIINTVAVSTVYSKSTVFPEEGINWIVNVRTAFPKRALTAADAERLRAREATEMIVRLDPPEAMERQGGAHRALLLTDGTLFELEYTGQEWTRQVRSAEAGRVELLDAVMADVAERRSP